MKKIAKILFCQKLTKCIADFDCTLLNKININQNFKMRKKPSKQET